MSIMVKSASFEKEISGSQHNFGASLFATGVYSSSFAIDAFDSTVISGSTTVADFVRDSGSITFDVFWRTNDKTYTFKTGSLTVKKQQITAFDNDTTRLVANIGNLKSAYKKGEKVRLRFFAFDFEEQVTAVKVPLYRSSEILTRCYYRVRDAYNDEVIIPFDEEDDFNATLMSTDSKGMYFDLYTDDFSLGRVYTIDVKIKRDNTEQVFKNVAGTFRIDP
jgi:formylmethanofuran dehydrogenase subunit A